jgi:hypothetical protein
MVFEFKRSARQRNNVEGTAAYAITGLNGARRHVEMTVHPAPFGLKRDFLGAAALFWEFEG